MYADEENAEPPEKIELVDGPPPPSFLVRNSLNFITIFFPAGIFIGSTANALQVSYPHLFHEHALIGIRCFLLVNFVLYGLCNFTLKKLILI